jgi:hypothetical protein
MRILIWIRNPGRLNGNRYHQQHSLPISLIEDSWRLTADDLCRDVAQDMFTEEEGGEAGGRLEFQVYTLFGDIF